MYLVLPCLCFSFAVVGLACFPFPRFFFVLILLGALIAGIINEFPGNDTLSQYDCFVDFI